MSNGRKREGPFCRETCQGDQTAHSFTGSTGFELPCPGAGASELSVPTFAWRSGALATTAYYLLSHVAEALSQREAKALLTVVFIGHGLLSDVLGRPLDFTQPVARILHGVLNIPVPGQTSAGAPAISEQSKGKEDKKKQ